MNFAPKSWVLSLIGWLALPSAHAQTAGSSILTHPNKSENAVLYAAVGQIFPMQQTGNARSNGQSQSLHQGQILPNLLQPSIKQNALQIQVFPNPCQNQVTVEIVSPSIALQSIALYDVTGKCVHKQTNPLAPMNRLNLTLNHLSEGVYTLALYPSAETSLAPAFVKLIKQQ